MIARIVYAGLGPHVDSHELEMDPDGVTRVAGPSESGKSTLIDAACFALTGRDSRGRPLDLDAIHDDADRAMAEITTASGNRIYRSVTRSRSTTRRFNDESLASDAALAEKLGAIAATITAGKREVLAAQLVMAPLSWVPLAESAHGGSELRDVLASLVEADVEAILRQLMADAGHELRDAHTAPLTAKQVETLRKLARDDARRLEGALTEARAAAAAITPPPPPPSEDDVAWARKLREVSEAWSEHDAAAARAAQSEAAIADWHARREALGDEPAPPDEAKLTAAREQFAAAKKKLSEAVVPPEPTEGEAVKKARRELEDAEKELARLEAAGPTCPTCQREWSEAAAALEAASEAVTGCREALRIAEEADAERRAAEEKKREAVIAKRAKLAEQMAAAQESAAADSDADRACKAFRSGVLALGPCPARVDPPEEPEFERPTPDEDNEAAAIMRAAIAASGAAQQHERSVEAARRRIEQAAEAAEEAQVSAAYHEALVEAVRRAPGEQLRGGLEALGDLGPVSLDVTDTGVRVLVDGRSYHLASRGRLVCADAWLRLALRRALGMEWLPIFVDDASAWTGDWPEADGPVVFLVTEAREGVAVEVLDAA